MKLKLHYIGHLMQRIDSLKETLVLWKITIRRRGRQRMRWLGGITDSMDVSLWTPRVGDGQGGLACSDSWGRKESDTTERLNWTELNWIWNFSSLATLGEGPTHWKRPDVGNYFRQEKKGTTEYDMVVWHHQLNGLECEQPLGVGDGQGSLVCCSPWGSQRFGHDWVSQLIKFEHFDLLAQNEL